MPKGHAHPFRGPTPPKVFQTVDVGAGYGYWMQDQALGHPQRKYAAVDPHLKPGTTYGEEPEGTTGPYHELVNAGVTVHPHKLETFIDRMLEEGTKTRHFNFDMPSAVADTSRQYNLAKLFANAHRLVVPNGKIYFKSESRGTLERIMLEAKRHGLFAKKIGHLNENTPVDRLRTNFMRNLAYDHSKYRQAPKQPKEFNARHIHTLAITVGRIKPTRVTKK